MSISSSPPRAPPVEYNAPHGTRWAKEKAAAGGASAFDLPTDPSNIGPWIIGECVGKGASGRVKIARHKVTGQLAAVKILPLAPLLNSRTSLATRQQKTEKQRLGIDREITMMKLMNHPNILRIYDVYEGATELFLVLEYVQGGELFDFLVNKGRLAPIEALAFFKQIVYGLNYAHTFSIIHRDLKPENILIASLSPPLIKIADWGMAAFAPPSLQLETSCGSPHYASPEIVNGHKYRGNATDIWSCGVILFALLTGRLPFDDKNVKTLLDKVKAGKYNMPSWMDPLAQDLIARMLVIDVNRRITLPEILSHPWMQSSNGVLPKTLGLDIPRVLDDPPLPPSPSVLARPIEDPSLIDQELLASLRIIWGRHTDPDCECIKQDLCSPAGQGVHAKAFYFLLGKYRDETSRFAPVLPQRLEISQHALGSFNLNWELDMGGLDSAVGRDTSSHVRAKTTPIPVQFSGIAPPIMARTLTNASRDRPPSPGGPRAPPLGLSRQRQNTYDPSAAQKSAPIVESAHPHPKSSFALAHNGSGRRPIGPKRGYTYSATTDRGNASRIHLVSRQLSQRSSQTSNGEQKEMQDSPPPLASKYSAPIPIRRVNHGENAKPPLPLFTVPHTRNVDMEQLADSVNALEVDDRMDVDVRVGPQQAAKIDKENVSFIDEGWSYITDDAVRVGPDRECGKDIANLAFPPDATRLKREKAKARPPPLEFQTNHKRSTFSGATPPLSPAMYGINSPSARLLTSPVVGEFKGWFSNLFGWKNHPQGSGILHSNEEVHKTSRDVLAVLQSVGVIVDVCEAEIMSGSLLFRCQVEETNQLAAIHIGARNLRFRIEFVSTSTSNPTTPLSPPVHPNLHLGSHISSSTVTSRTRSKSSSYLPVPASSLLPSNCLSAMMVIHEKGSMSSFRAIWKKLKCIYAETASQSACLSPTMVNTPMADFPPRFPVC